MKILALALFLPCVLLAAEPPLDLSEALRKGLFAEEATRDLKAATQHYQAIIDAYGTQRKYAGTALFRLAEIKRKEGDKDAAAKLYQQVVVEFADDQTLASLSRDNLKALGVKTASTENEAAMVDDETKEIARLTALFETSPDLLSNWVGKEPPPLHAAVTKNQRKVVEFLLKRGVKVNLEAQGSTALDAACGAGNMAMATLLIEHGADIHGREATTTPFGKAYDNRMTQVARMLIEKGADPNRAYWGPSFGNTQGIGGWSIATPLTHALIRNDAEMVNLLITKGADVNKPRPSQQPSSPRPLLPSGESPKGEERSTPIAIAARTGKAALVRTLLAAGAKVNVDKDDYPVPLHEAISSGSEECVKLLIEAKADVNSRVGQYESPLSLAAMAGSEVIVKLLLDAGARPNTPWVLLTAVAPQQSPKPEFLRFLVNHGIRDIQGIRFSDLAPEIEAALHELRYPEWFALPQVTFFPPGSVWAERKKDTDQPPELWNLASANRVTVGRVDPASCVIVRRSADGKGIQRLPFDLAAWADNPVPEKLPKLQWGDVLEFKPVEAPPTESIVPGIPNRRRQLIPAPGSIPTSPFSPEAAERLRKAGAAK